MRLSLRTANIGTLRRVRRTLTASRCVVSTASMSTEWPGAKVRSSFVEFFKTKQHTFFPSSSVVPVNDPTLLFANAGGWIAMLGAQTRLFSRSAPPHPPPPASSSPQLQA